MNAADIRAERTAPHRFKVPGLKHLARAPGAARSLGLKLLLLLSLLGVPATQPAHVAAQATASPISLTLNGAPFTGWNFGSVAVGQGSFVNHVTLHNTSAGPLSLGGVDGAALGPDFGFQLFAFDPTACIANTPNPLPSGGSCTFDLPFIPRTAGVKQATLQFIDLNLQPIPGASVPLVGVGVPVSAPLLALSLDGATATTSPSLDFGSVSIGQPAAQKQLSVLGQAGGSLAVVLSGNPLLGEGLNVSTTCASGAPCTISVTFAPSVAGVQNALLKLVDASGTPLAALPLVGTAVQAQATNPTPSITSISPTSVAKGSTNVTLTVSGSGFTSTSQVHVTYTDPTTRQLVDTPLSTTTTGASTGTLAATLATAPPDAALVTVVNPGAAASTPFGPLFVVAAGATCGSTCITASAVDTLGSTSQPVKLPCCNLLARGTGTVSIAQYTPGSAAGLPAFSVGNIAFDVFVWPGNNLTSITLDVCGIPQDAKLRPTAQLFWINPQTGRPSVVKGDPTKFDANFGCYTVTLDGVSSPTLSQLTGTLFAEAPVPSITASATSNGAAYTAGNWTNHDVTVTFSCTTPVGVASVSPAAILSAEGGDQSATGTCTDNLDGSASTTFDHIDIDKTPPTTAATPAPGALPAGTPLVSVTASATVKDNTGATLGTINPLQCWDTQGVAVGLAATDKAGGSGVASLTYSASGAQVLASTTATGSTASVPIAAAGLSKLTYAAADTAGNQEATKSLSVLVGAVDNGKTGFACAAPTPTFAMPAHGSILLTGTASSNGLSVPFSKTFKF